MFVCVSSIFKHLNIQFIWFCFPTWHLFIKNSPLLRWRYIPSEPVSVREVINWTHSYFDKYCFTLCWWSNEIIYVVLNQDWAQVWWQTCSKRRRRKIASLLGLNITDMTGERSIFLAHIMNNLSEFLCLPKNFRFWQMLLLKSLLWNQFDLQVFGDLSQATSCSTVADPRLALMMC